MGRDGPHFVGAIGVGVLRLGAGIEMGTAVFVDSSVSLSGVSIAGSFVVVSCCAVGCDGAAGCVSATGGVKTAGSGPCEIEGTTEGAFEVGG